MKKEMQIEQARYLMDRYDRYLQAVDLKANIIAVYHFTIIGSVVFNYDDLKVLLGGSGEASVLFQLATIGVIAVSLISIIFLLLTIFPFLKSNTRKGKNHESLIFFKSVHEMGQKNFELKFSKQEDDDMIEDYRIQLFNLASGLSRKFKYLSTAGKISFLHLLIGIVLIIVELL